MDSQNVLALLIILCISYVIMNFIKIWKEKAQLPPGPTPLPFIGNLLQIDTNDIVKSLLQLKDKYGPVYTLYYGPYPAVVICGYEAMKEALIDQAETFGERGDYPSFSHNVGGHDIGFTKGEKSKERRRFALITLRNFGMGKRSVEERIQEEAHYLIEELKETNGTPTDVTGYLSRSVSNVICSIVFGNRFDYTDKRLLTITQSINNVFSISSSTWGTLYNMYAGFMDYLPGPHWELHKNFQSISDIIEESIKYHQETLDPSCPRDYIDCFLIKMKEEGDNPEPAFYTKSLVMTSHDLLFGGTETVGTTLKYGLLILMKYPEIAERIQEEIDQVVGRDRSPSIGDRNQMPYTDATIHEIMRFCDVIPLGLPRCTTRETFFRGYSIPKDTFIIQLLTSVHFDPTQYKEPNKFSPNNFLDEHGRFKRNDALMPFSAGKRVCPGESLARMELFIYFTFLLQNFHFKPVIREEDIVIDRIGSGLRSVLMGYKCCLIPR
ncbi:cytochrome P450 2F3-like isoform 1-T3 [Rhinophrynus dorsalis]